MYNHSIVFSLVVFAYSSNVSNTFQPLYGGYHMPSVGFGTFTLTDEDQLAEALNRALEVGYRHIDTASMYENEHIIGKVLKQWFSSGKLKRRDVFITTKLHPLDMHPDRVQSALTLSLSNLRVKYVDSYLIHMPVAMTKKNKRTLVAESADLIGIWRKMEEEVYARRARTIGLCNFNEDQIKRILYHAAVRPACLQTEIHPYYQQRKLRDFCRKNDILVIGYAPLGSPGIRRYFDSVGRGKPPVKSLDILNDPVIMHLAHKYKKTPAQIVLRYLHQQHVVVIPRSSDYNRIEENTKIFNFELSVNDTNKMKNLDRGNDGKIFHLLNLAQHMGENPEYPFPDLFKNEY